MMKAFKIGCLGVVVILAFVMAVGFFTFLMMPNSAKNDGGTSSSSQQASSSSSAKQKQQMEDYTCEIQGLGKVKGGYTSNVGVAIYKIEQVPSLGQNRFAHTEAQGKFIVISMVVSNGQKDAITVNANSFKLKDEEGREYSYSHEGQMAIDVDDKDQKAMLRKVNPGITISITVPYDVPQDADISKMYLEAHGGMTGSPIKLPLKVQMEQ